MSTEGLGVVRIDMRFLGDVIHLPAGHRIVRASEADNGSFGIIELLVEGPDLPIVKVGEIVPWVNLTVTVTESETFVRQRTFEGRFA